MKSRYRRMAVFVIFLAVTTVIPWGCGTTTGSYGILRVLGSPPPARRALRGGSPVTLNVIDRNGTTTGTLLVEDARVVLKDIRIEFGSEAKTPEEIEQDNRIEYPGPYVANLLTNTTTPELGRIPLLPGLYRQIELKLKRIDGTETDATGAPLVGPSDALFGNSIYLAGKYTGPYAGGTAAAMPVVMSYDFDETFSLSPPGGSVKGMNVRVGENSVLIAYRLAQWVNFANPLTNDKNVDFTLAVDVAGTLRFDHAATGVNADIRTVIKNAIEQSADYGVDENQDGVLSSDEDDSR